MSEYKIIFKGEITSESNREKIEPALAKFFNIPAEKASGLFNGKAYALKKGLTLNASELMQTKFKNIGVITHLIKEDSVADGISSQERIEKNEGEASNNNEKYICMDCGSLNVQRQACEDQIKQQTKKAEHVDINKIDVSPSWLNKFELLNKVEANSKFILSAMQGDKFKKLSLMEKHKISFNWLAFLFSSLYYFSKKMWFKGSFILGTSWVLAGSLTLIEFVLNAEIPGYVFWVLTGSICANLASYDYYKLKTVNEKIWSGLPSIFEKPVGAIGYLVLAFAFVILSGYIQLTAVGSGGNW